MPEIKDARRLIVTLHAYEHEHHHLLVTEVMARALHHELAGATVLPALSPTEDPGLVPVGPTGDLTVEIVIVDTADRILAFLTEIEPLVGATNARLERVQAWWA